MSIGGAAYLAEADVLAQPYDPVQNVTLSSGINSSGAQTGVSYASLTSAGQFGFSVALSDDGLTLVAGSPEYNASLEPSAHGNGDAFFSGAFSVFTRSSTSAAWEPFPSRSAGVNVVYPAGAAVFSNAAGQATSGAFKAAISSNVYNSSSLGWAVALSGDASTLLVSALTLGLLGTSFDTFSRGGVFVYTRTNSGYVPATQTPLIQPSPTSANGNSYFGFAIAVSQYGEVVVVGDPAYGIGAGAVGSFWVYARSTAPGNASAYVPLYNYASIGTPLLGRAPGNQIAVLGNAVAVSAVSQTANTAFTVVVGASYATGIGTGIRGSPGGHFVLNVPQNVYQTVVSSGAPYPASSLPVPTAVDATTTAFANAIAAYVTCTFPTSMLLGSSVAISRDGSTIAVGAPTDNTANTSSSSPLICGLALIFAVNSSTGITLPSQVLYQPNYVSSANNVPVSPTGNNVLGFGASVALSADARTLVVGACDPTSYLNSTQVPAAQNYGYVFVYTLINGVYTQVSGTNYAYGYTFPYVRYRSGGSSVANGTTTKGNELTSFLAITFHNATLLNGTIANSIALSANGQVVAVGLPQYSSKTPQLMPSNTGTYLGTGFQEGAVLTFLVRQAIAQILALEDEVGPACDNDYNDLIVRTGYNALQPLQMNANTTGPLYFTLALDFLRLSSSNAVAVYLVLDDGLFTYANVNAPYAGWSIAYYYEGSQVGSTLATGSLSAQHLSGLGLQTNYGAGFTGANVIQVYTNTAGCVPSAFTVSPSAFYAAWNAAQLAPYAATAVLRAPIVANGSTGLSPDVSASPPFALVFACTHADGSIGYVAPYALIEDPTNAQVIANEAATGVTTIQKVVLDNTEISAATPNGTFQPTQEYVPLVDVYPGASSDYGGDTAYKLATGSTGVSFGSPVDLTLRLPPVGPSAAWTSTTANWVWVQASE